MDMPQASAAADRRAALRGQVIVVLEDDDLVRRATERLLRRCGAEVVAARSSGEALASLAARRLAPWCIVADYWLSHEESGLAAVAALRTAALQTAAATPPHAVVVTRSEEHTSELQSLMRISYAVFCLKKKTK